MPSNLNILFLGEPSSPNTTSWVEGLQELGCKVSIASARSDGSDGAYPIGPIHFPPRMRMLLGAEDVKKLIRKLKPDLLIAYRITSYGYLAASVGFHPLVLAAQNEHIVYLPHPSKLRKKLLEFFVRFAIKKADLIHAWGENIKNGLLKYGAKEEAIFVLHRGIDLQTFDPLKNKEKDFNPDSPVFISTRSLYPEYQIDKIIRAFKIVQRKIPKAMLKIIGSGSEESKLKVLAPDLGIQNNVIFYGKLNKDALAEQLRHSDIYISVIQTEGISSSLLECCACGLLPIVGDIPSSRILIRDRINGYLVSDLPSEQLAGIMLDAVTHFKDMGAEFLNNRIEIQKKFDRSQNLKIFLDKYLSLAGPAASENIIVRYPVSQPVCSPLGVLTVSELSEENIIKNRLGLFAELAESMPEIPFYIVGNKKGDADDFLFSLPYNCLHIPDSGRQGLDWALKNTSIYCHLARYDFSGACLYKAIRAGLTSIICGRSPLFEFPSDNNFRETSLTVSLENLSTVIKTCVNNAYSESSNLSIHRIGNPMNRSLK